MKKVKYKINEKVASYDFDGDILNKNLLQEVCKIFDLKEIYMDIYSVDNRKEDLCDLLKRKCKKILISTTGKNNCQHMHLKISIHDCPIISETLADFYFEDINIWDCYCDWEKYLEDKTAKIPFLTIKRIEYHKDHRFYLNYKENHVEIICDLTYGNQELFSKINELIN